MKLSLDGQNVDTAELSAETFAELINNLEQEIAPERVIVSLTLDGEKLDETDEKDRAQTLIDDLANLEIRTQKVTELARNTLTTLIDYMPGLIDSVDGCTGMLQGENEKDGHLGLSTLIDGLQMAAAAWKGIAYFVKIKDIEPREVMPDMQSFNFVLNSVVQAQENGDIVQICDLLEFELSPMLESWLDHAVMLRDGLR